MLLQGRAEEGVPAAGQRLQPAAGRLQFPDALPQGRIDLGGGARRPGWLGVQQFTYPGQRHPGVGKYLDALQLDDIPRCSCDSRTDHGPVRRADRSGDSAGRPGE